MKAKKCPVCGLWNSETQNMCARCKEDLLTSPLVEYINGQDATWLKQAEDRPERQGDILIPGKMKRGRAKDEKSILTLSQSLFALVIIGLGIFVVLPFLELRLNVRGYILAATIAGGIVLDQFRRVWPKKQIDTESNQPKTAVDEVEDDDNNILEEEEWSWKCQRCLYTNSGNTIFCGGCGKVRDLSKNNQTKADETEPKSGI